MSSRKQKRLAAVEPRGNVAVRSSNVPIQQLRMRHRNVIQQGKEIKESLQKDCLSNCVKRYLEVLTKPFTSSSTCIPIPPCMPSSKLAFFTKGTLTTSTTLSNGGFIYLTPGRGCVSDVAGIAYTDNVTGGAYAGTAFAWTGAGITNAYSNSTFLDAEISATGAKVRLVAAGVRVRYRGTELNRGGSIYGLMEPDHQNLTGLGVTQLLAYANVKSTKVSEDWFTILYEPVDALDYDYNATSDFVDACMGIYIKPAVAESTFDFEVFAHYEYIGPNVPGKTKSESDPIGGWAVIDAIQNVTGHISNGVYNARRLIESASSIVNTYSGNAGAGLLGAAAGGARLLELV